MSETITLNAKKDLNKLYGIDILRNAFSERKDLRFDKRPYIVGYTLENESISLSMVYNIRAEAVKNGTCFSCYTLIRVPLSRYNIEPASGELEEYIAKLLKQEEKLLLDKLINHLQ